MTTTATIDAQMEDAYHAALHLLGRPPTLCELGPKRWPKWVRHLSMPPFNCDPIAITAMRFWGMRVVPMAEPGVRVS